MSNDNRIQQLLDKQEIKEVVLRYCRGIDRLDWDLVRSCYHDDAEDEHGHFRGSVDEFVEWSSRIVSRYELTMHFIGNSLVEVDGDRARCESYAMAFHRSKTQDAKHNLIVGFRYVDDFERRDGTSWRIAKRICATEWVRVDVPENHWPIPEGMRTGSRDKSDVVYAPLR